MQISERIKRLLPVLINDMMRALAVTVLFAGTAAAQQPSSRVEQLLELRHADSMALSLLKADSLVSARIYADRVVVLSQALDDREKLAATFKLIARIYDEVAVHDSVIFYEHKAAAVPGDRSRTASWQNIAHSFFTKTARVAIKAGRDTRGLDSAIVYQRRARVEYEARGDDARTIAAAVALGRYLGAAGRTEEAVAELNSVGNRIRKIAADSTRVVQQMRLAFRYARLQEMDRARVLIDEALPTIATAPRPQRGYLHRLAGGALREIGEHARAFQSIHAALAEARSMQDRTGTLTAISDLAWTHHELGQSDSALTYLQQALVDGAAIDPTNTPVLLRRIGNVYLSMDRPDSALAAYRAALDQLGPRQYDEGAQNFLGISRVFRQVVRPDSAAWYVERAYELSLKALDPSISLDAVLAMGEVTAQRISTLPDTVAHVARRNVMNALRGMIPVARIADRSELIPHIERALGVHHRERFSADSALHHFRSARRQLERAGDVPGQALTFLEMAKTFEQESQSDSAFAALARARALLQNVRAPATLARVYALHGELLRYQENPNMERVVAFYDSAVATINAVTRAAGDEHNSTNVAETAIEMYDGLLDAMSWLPPTKGSDKTAVDALQAAETSKAKILGRLIGSGKNRGTSDAAPNVLEATLAALRASNAAAAIAFYSGEHRLMSFLVTRDSLVVMTHRSLGADTLATFAEAARLEISAPIIARRGTAAADALAGRLAPQARREQMLLSLSQALLGPILHHLPPSGEIIISPHGALSALPFAALPIGNGEYFGLKYGLRYVPSLALVEPRKRANNDKKAVVMADPALATPLRTPTFDQITLARLKWAASEGNQVAALLGAKPRIGANATETQLRAVLPDADIVHIATHGVSYQTDEKSRFSFVALAADSVHDGTLTAAEIMQLPPLKADLVVLSACETGLGTIKKTEGVVGLPRALLANGVRATLVSLWSVDDRASADLMVRFHSLLAAGHNKTEALRRAQLELAAVYPNPAYWAAFQLIGFN